MLLRAFFYSPTREIRAGIAPVKAVVAQPEPFAFHHGACRGIPARLPPEQLASCKYRKDLVHAGLAHFDSMQSS